MDIKVLVEGVAREVCGVSTSTTCEEIIIKLAQAANLPGFYTLVAAYRGREDILSADERISDFFRKISARPSHVQFILRRLEALSPPGSSQANPITSHKSSHSSSSGVGRPSSRSAHAKPIDADCYTGYSSTANEIRSPKTSTNSSRSQTSSSNWSAHTINRSLQSSIGPQRIVSEVIQGTSVLPDTDAYKLLEDQLASQEQEVELNGIRLIQLDKEIAELEHATCLLANTDLAMAGGLAAELAHLAATPWPQLLEANRSRQIELIREKNRYQLALERVTTQLEQTQNEAFQLESKAGNELDNLLSTLDTANAQRRQLLRSLSPTPFQGRPSLGSKSGGVPV